MPVINVEEVSRLIGWMDRVGRKDSYINGDLGSFWYCEFHREPMIFTNYQAKALRIYRNGIDNNGERE
jgi:hypothetical protein